MPFDPDKYLEQKQSAQADAPSAGAGFNPDQYLQSKGVNTLSNDGNIKDGATAAKAFGQQAADTYNKYSQNVGQGAALGFGSQLNAGIQSAAGAVDQAVNGQNNFGDQSSPDASATQRTLDAISNMGENYTRAKKGVDEAINKTRASDPIKAGLAELAGAIAPTSVTGAGLSSLGATNGIAQAGLIGAPYSFGSSQKEGVDRLVDTAKGTGVALATAGALSLAGKGISALKNTDYGQYLQSEYGDYSKPVKAIQDLTASSAKEDPYALDYKTKFGEPFRVGREMGQAMSDPNVQASVSKELNDQPQIAQGIIDQTKQKIGTMRDALQAQHGDQEVDMQPTLKKIYNFIDGINIGKSDADRIAAKSDLRDAVAAIEDGLGQKTDPMTNATSKTTFGDLLDAQKSFGKDVFENKVFSKDNVINGAAKKVWGMLSDSANAADESVGSGGQISTINKTFKALYSMEDNMISGQTIKSLTDPQAVGAENKFANFVKPFEELPPNVRDTLAPEMHDYLANQFPKTFSKAKVMLLATERGAQSALSNKNFWSLAGLRGLAKATSANVQNTIGALSTMPLPGASLSEGAQNGINSALQTVAPSLGAMSQDNNPQPQRSLNQLK